MSRETQCRKMDEHGEGACPSAIGGQRPLQRVLSEGSRIGGGRSKREIGRSGSGEVQPRSVTRKRVAATDTILFPAFLLAVQSGDLFALDVALRVCFKGLQRGPRHKCREVRPTELQARDGRLRNDGGLSPSARHDAKLAEVCYNEPSRERALKGPERKKMSAQGDRREHRHGARMVWISRKCGCREKGREEKRNFV